MQYLGRISYSLYLWHWPVIVILRWTIGDSGWMYVVLALGLTFFLAILSYHFVEKKINYANVRRAMSDNRIVLSSLASLMALSVLGWGVFKSHSILTMSVTGDHRVWYSAPSADISTLQGSDKKRLFVLGDSHVGAYSEMLRMLEENNQWDVLSYFRAGCSMADLLKPAQETCKQEMLALVKEVIAKSRPGDAVFLAALRSNRLSDQWFSFKESDIQASVEQTRMLQQESVEQAHGVIELLEKSGLIVILDAPKPVFRSPPFRCSDWFNQMNPVCLSGLTISRDYLVQHNQPVMRAIEQLKQMHPGLKVWDSFPILCTGAYCHAKENGIPMFFDGDHLSGHGNRKLYPYFLEFMGQLRTGSLMNQAHVSAAHE
jgi:SGNH domain (fused to AT3 domains)